AADLALERGLRQRGTHHKLRRSPKNNRSRFVIGRKLSGVDEDSGRTIRNDSLRDFVGSYANDGQRRLHEAIASILGVVAGELHDVSQRLLSSQKPAYKCLIDDANAKR